MYVFNTRETTSGIRYAKAKVNNVNGVILLPDNWSTSYYTLNSTNTATADYTTNTINSSQWSTLEQHGAVFLPAAGYRTNGTSLYNPGYIGFYWSASKDRSDTACNVKFIDSNLLLDGFSHHNIGNSVRLVYPAQ